MRDESGRATWRPARVRALQSVGLSIVLLVATCPLSFPERAAGQEATTEIIVTTNSDVSNGDTSTVAALKANPGPDGISLREAIFTTNNDPGSHMIRFDAALAGATIAVDTALPPLLAGGVTIDGDVDGDAAPNITISAGPAGDANLGFHIGSGNNRLHALKLSGFRLGVFFGPLATPEEFPTNTTFADNSVDGLVMENVGFGIDVESVSCGNDPNFPPPCPSHNTWANTTITNNTIEASGPGIKFFISGTGDRVEGATITDNVVHLGADASEGIAVSLAGNSDGGRISDVLIARNSVEGEADIGIYVTGGDGRAQGGITEGVRILSNSIHLVKQSPKFCCQGIVINAGSDNPSFATGPPVRYLDDNTARDVVVRNNVVSGTLEWGIALQAAWGGGGRRNHVRDIRIKQNVVRTSLPRLGVAMVIGGGTPYDNRYTSDNRIAGVVIASNRFAIGTGPDFRNAGPGIMAAGIALIGGGSWSRDNVVRDVRMARNTIKSSYFGIEIIGGLEDTARRNRVICVPLRENRIRGARKDVSIRANVRGAIGNKVRLGGC